MPVENVTKLTDGRTIFTTHNGFKFHLTDKKGTTLEVDEDYFNKALQKSVSVIPFTRQQKLRKIKTF